ncbi:ComF family protein [Candidatus Peregrinibacteria bacterium]|nr:ComF family protein [Candidatus Peregrinibacteria bacterium]
MHFFVALKNWLLDLIFPDFCLGCNTEGFLVCGKCRSGVKISEKDFCPACRKESFGGFFCSSKCKTGFYFDALVVCLPYIKEGLMKKVIVRFKYHFSKGLSEFLGEILRQKLGKFRAGLPAGFSAGGHTDYLIVPVPLHKNRLKYRGFNQSEILAKALGEPKILLERKVETSEQALLSRAERMKNVQGAFGLNLQDLAFENGENFSQGKIFLVDDVATTLSTLNECSKVLKTAGAKEIICIVLARGN